MLSNAPALTARQAWKITAAIALCLALFLLRGELALLPVEHGAGWAGSPAGKLASRLVYSRAQIPWHRGVDESFELGEGQAPPSAGPTEWMERLREATRPPHVFAHQSGATLEELAKGQIVIRQMRWSLACDPANWGTAYDLAYLLLGQSQPALALEVLDQILAQPLDPAGRLTLLVAKFQLLVQWPGHAASAQALQAPIRSAIGALESAWARGEFLVLSKADARALLAVARALVGPRAGSR